MRRSDLIPPVVGLTADDHATVECFHCWQLKRIELTAHSKVPR